MRADPDYELPEFLHVSPVEERLWKETTVEKAKDKAIDAKLRSQPAEDGVPDEWTAPEGFCSVKQARAMGFTKRQLGTLLPEPAMMVVEGSERPMRVWRAEDVEKAMRTNAFLKKSQKRLMAEREEAWRAVCADYGSDSDF